LAHSSLEHSAGSKQGNHPSPASSPESVLYLEGDFEFIHVRV